MPKLIRSDVTLAGLLRDPQTWFTLARHSIPLVGVAFFGWSALEGMAAIVLDTLSALWGIAAIGTWFATSAMTRGPLDSADWMNVVVTRVVAFVFVGALLTFMLGVMSSFLWAYVIGTADVDLRALATSATLWKGFAAMLALQVPRVWQFIRTHDEPSAKAVIQPELGFLLTRFVLIVICCSFLSVLPGDIALLAALGIAQALLAACELFGDRLLAPLGIAVAPEAAAQAPQGAGKHARKRKRK
jgi:hypothetical protein